MNFVLIVAQKKVAEVAYVPFPSRLELVYSIKLSWPKACLLGKLKSPIVLVALQYIRPVRQNIRAGGQFSRALRKYRRVV